MSNREKAKALGMSHGAAANKLRKMILFDLVCRLGLNVCYQCGEKIADIADLSIEHKVPWLRANDPVQVYFDLGNIAFSHLSCNIRASTTPGKKYYNKDEKKTGRANSDRKYYYNVSPEERKKKRRARYERDKYNG